MTRREAFVEAMRRSGLQDEGIGNVLKALDTVATAQSRSHDAEELSPKEAEEHIKRALMVHGFLLSLSQLAKEAVTLDDAEKN